MSMSYIQGLQNLLEGRKLKNSSYSFRALARDLEIDSSYLHKLLHGKKAFPPRLVYKIGLELGLETEELLGFLKPVLEHGKQ